MNKSVISEEYLERELENIKVLLPYFENSEDVEFYNHLKGKAAVYLSLIVEFYIIPKH